MRSEVTWLGIGCLALACCSSDSPVGKSGFFGTNARLAPPTAIVASAGEQLGWYAGSVGDLDGDGRDDFVIYGQPSAAAEEADWVQRHLSPENPNHPPYTRIYLFYGRERFPEKLSSGDADAILDGKILHSGSIGDVNGDGKADLLIAGENWAQFIFGSSRRLQGKVDVAMFGVRWLGPKQSGNSLFGERTLAVTRAGDVNGDGLSDLLVGVAGLLPASPESGDPWSRFLILGRKDGWFAGMFQASWAQAKFDGGRAEADGRNAIAETATALGDIDGDGYADVSAIGSYSTARVFYGGPDRLHGFLGADQADAVLDHDGSGLWPVGDVDGDGRSDLGARAFDDESGTFGPTSVVYSPATRWSGTTTPVPGLAISLPVDPDPRSGDGITDIRAADVDQDGIQDILLAAPSASEIYLIRGSRERQAGSYRLQDSDLLMRGVNFREGTGRMVGDALGSSINVDGDLDGNGGPDVLAGAPGQLGAEPQFSGGTVYLIPGTGPRPL